MKINETKHSTILVYNIEYFIMSQYIYICISKQRISMLCQQYVYTDYIFLSIL